jgi:hypothetical protein
MRSTCKRTCMLALSGVLPGILLAFLTLPVSAQPVGESQVARGPIATYNAAHEVTISGTVQQVVTKHAVGSPAGMHLLVSGAQGLVDAHVGPHLTKSMKEALHMGLPLEIVGAMTTVRGKQFLLARQLVYGGQTVTVRNSRGFLLTPARSSLSPSPEKGGRPTLGGVQ